MNLFHDERTVSELSELGLIESCFTYFSDWLESLDISVNDAAIYFLIDYTTAKCRYTDLVIQKIAKMVAETNAKKYDKLIAIYAADYDPLTNYDRTETSTHIRTPQLTTGTTSSATSGASNSSTTTDQTKQTHTQTTTPSQYGTTTEKSVAPFDTSVFKPQEKTVSTNAGTLTVSDAYSGDPDTSTTSGTSSTNASATTTTEQTGSETTGIQSHIVGNIGVTTSQQMAEAEIALAAKMAVFKTIEQDLAAKLLLQVWD